MEEMRRKDREVTELEAVKEIIRQCDVLRLGLADGDYPYIVPMNFGWEEKEGRLYFYLHGAAEGRKAELQAHAERRGESLNGFIVRAVDETIERDNEKEGD